jgi:general L-amino acid transport system substrate-binding protein
MMLVAKRLLSITVKCISRIPLILTALVVVSASSVLASTLEKVKRAGVLTCGVNTNTDDWSKHEPHGDLAAFEVDICKAIAAAVLGSADKARFVAFNDDDESAAGLRAGKVDVLALSTPSIAGASAGFGFGPIIFYDAEGFLVPKSSNISRASELAGKKICFMGSTGPEENLKVFLGQRNIAYQPYPFEEQGEMEAAFYTNQCQVYAADMTELAVTRLKFRAAAKNYVILPERIVEDPIAPAFRAKDPQWAAIVTWTINALIEAERYGVTRANLAARRASSDPDIQRLLGIRGHAGRALGLSDAWAAQAIGAVGNYGEIFDRDLGAGSPLKLERGLSALWTRGGLLYAPPVR